ncbi:MULTISPECIES: hypothetical protein [unclassified Streptomyces]|uniref:hypothetical protein n=1 Tax=unclassified Streptomyces TaxID=2593676 RepID=UPI0036A70E56
MELTTAPSVERVAADFTPSPIEPLKHQLLATLVQHGMASTSHLHVLLRPGRSRHSVSERLASLHSSIHIHKCTEARIDLQVQKWLNTSRDDKQVTYRVGKLAGICVAWRLHVAHQCSSTRVVARSGSARQASPGPKR